MAFKELDLMTANNKTYVRTQYTICRRSDYNMLHMIEKSRQEMCALVNIKPPRISKILKRSNNPESLCDEFVCESNEEGNEFRHTYTDVWKMMRDDFFLKHQEHYDFYGAIRVKGQGTLYKVIYDKKEKRFVLCEEYDENQY